MTMTDNNTFPTVREDQHVFSEYETEKLIVKIFTPCILAVGAFGNIATICVMRRIKDHNSSQHAILTTLAVSDFLLILTTMVFRFLWYYFHIDMRLWHWLVCKLYYWMLYTSGMLSAWLVTCVTVQRAMSITWPHKMRAVCTLRRTWIVIASIVFATSFINGHLLVGMEITSDNSCNFGTAGYLHFFVMWTWVDLLLSSVVPALCQIVCDVILCLALFKAASMSGTVQTTSDANTQHDRKKTASNITVTCLALSCTFLVLTSPICIQLLWFHFVHLTLTPASLAQQILMQSVCVLLLYVNSAVNFFLYCITGTRFRQEFVNWICCRGQRHSTASAGDARAGTMKGRH